MKKIIRLTETDLHRIVKNSVKTLLRESSGDELLASRNVNCSTMQEQQFVQMMLQDILAAKEKWRELHYQKDVDAHNDRYLQRVNDIRRHAGELAQKLCRTQNGRQIFYNKMIERQKKDLQKEKFKWYHDLTYFDVELYPDKYGEGPSSVIVTKNGFNEEPVDEERITRQLAYIFEKHLDKSEWFRNAIGWKLIGRYSSRPEIKFIYSDEGEQQWNDIRNKRDKDIMDFYNSLHYKGD